MTTDPVFEPGATYRVRISFQALRDTFAAGQLMVYWDEAYSAYHGYWGFFFRDAASERTRSWDIESEAEARREAPRLFERVAGPDPLFLAASRGDLWALCTRLDEVSRTEAPLLWTITCELALEAAAQAGHAVVVEELLERVPTARGHRLRVLHLAAGAGQARVVEQLLDGGLPVDALDGPGQTPLVHAACSGDLDTVRLLLERGARADHRTPAGTSPRSLAAARKHTAVVALLDAWLAQSGRC